MRYLKRFEDVDTGHIIYNRTIQKDDQVVLLRKDNDSPFFASSSGFVVGDIYKVVGKDMRDEYRDEYIFNIGFDIYTKNNSHALTGGRTWVKADQIRKVTDADLAQIKYNL
jgi:hypothetical protein